MLNASKEATIGSYLLRLATAQKGLKLLT